MPQKCLRFKGTVEGAIENNGPLEHFDFCSPKLNVLLPYLSFSFDSHVVFAEISMHLKSTDNHVSDLQLLTY